MLILFWPDSLPPGLSSRSWYGYLAWRIRLYGQQWSILHPGNENIFYVFLNFSYGSLLTDTPHFMFQYVSVAFPMYVLTCSYVLGSDSYVLTLSPILAHVLLCSSCIFSISAMLCSSFHKRTLIGLTVNVYIGMEGGRNSASHRNSQWNIFYGTLFMITGFP